MLWFPPKPDEQPALSSARLFRVPGEAEQALAQPLSPLFLCPGHAVSTELGARAESTSPVSAASQERDFTWKLPL